MPSILGVFGQEVTVNFYSFLAYTLVHAGLFFLIYTCIIHQCYFLAFVLMFGINSWNGWNKKVDSKDYHGCYDCHFDGDDCTAFHDQLMSKGGPGLGSRCTNWKQRKCEYDD